LPQLPVLEQAKQKVRSPLMGLLQIYQR
jgi:hypothetical protein